jgi:GT2 family glycosyltransferase
MGNTKSFVRRKKSRDLMVSVSIVLITWSPTEDRMMLLKNTLNSLRDSTDISYELIVVDNGPNEQTEFLKTQKIDKHIINKVNQGIGVAKNQGVREATGDYVCFLDNDLLFEKDWLKESVEALEKHKDVKLIACPVFSNGARDYYKRFFKGMIGEYLLWQKTFEGCWIVRRETITEIGDWDEKGIKPCWDYCRRLQKAGYFHIGLPKQKVWHKGLKKTYAVYGSKFIRGKWVKYGREYWDNWWGKKWKRAIKCFPDMYGEIKKNLNGKIADLACGVTSLYMDGNYDVTGLDVSTIALEKSKELCPTGTFKFGKAERTGLPSNSFDTVVLSHIIEHYTDFTPILKEAKRICKKGGKIIISVPVKCFHPDHAHPVWNEEKINKEVSCFFGKITYTKFRKGWVIVCEN